MLAAALALGAGGSDAGAVTSRPQPGPPIWEEHGAGRKDGLAVGAYPLPDPETPGRSVDPSGEREARERWLRRHYEWLRALSAIAGAAGDAKNPAGRDAQKLPAFEPPDPPGALRLGDILVLYADRANEPAPDHLLDDGGAVEAPESGLRAVDVVEWIVGDRARSEAAQAEALGTLLPAPQAAAAPPVRMAASNSIMRPDVVRPSISPESAKAASPPPRRGPAEQDARTLLGFLRKLAADILSAPTTYLLAGLALLAWLIIRAAMFSRPRA